jgi:RND family efflux transporter MFP subunit
MRKLIKRVAGLRRRNKAAIFLVILAVLFIFFKGRQRTQALSYATVKREEIISTVSASGFLGGKNVSVMRFNTSGRLKVLGVSNGQQVHKGQLIAGLDDISQNALFQEALNNKRNTQAAVDNLYDQIKGHSSDETFSQRAARTAAEVANDNAYDNLKAAQQALNDTKIFAPFNGIVIIPTTLVAGQNVGPTDVIARVVDFSEKVMEASVDESDIGYIRVGQKAKVTLNAYGDKEFSGEVVEIIPSTQTDTTGAVTVTVRVRIDSGEISDIYGLNGNVVIVVSSKDNALIIPQDALVEDNHVYVKRVDGKIEKKEVVLGIKSDTMAEVVSGLNEGDQIVINPQAVK